VSTSEAVAAETRAIVERIAGPSRTPSEAGPHTRLADGYWLDSVELLEVVVACEEHFGVVFDDPGDLEAGALDTLGALSERIQAKRAARVASP
jgi:acyl carrier protein